MKRVLITQRASDVRRTYQRRYATCRFVLGCFSAKASDFILLTVARRLVSRAPSAFWENRHERMRDAALVPRVPLALPANSTEVQLAAMVGAMNRFYDRLRRKHQAEGGPRRLVTTDECSFFSDLARLVQVRPAQLFDSWDPVAKRGLLCEGAHGSTHTVLVLRFEDLGAVLEATRRGDGSTDSLGDGEGDGGGSGGGNRDGGGDSSGGGGGGGGDRGASERGSPVDLGISLRRCGPGTTMDLSDVVPKLDPWVPRTKPESDPDDTPAGLWEAERWRDVTKLRWRGIRGESASARLTEENSRWLGEFCDTAEWYR